MNKSEARSYALQKRKEVSIKQIEEDVIENYVRNDYYVITPTGRSTSFGVISAAIYYKDSRALIDFNK